MENIYEINMKNIERDVDTLRITKRSPIVEVFSALVQGEKPSVKGEVIDASVKTIKEMCSKAIDGDPVARSEINTIIRFAIEPKLLERIKLFSFMGTYHTVGYHEAVMVKTYNYESVDSRFQASSSDVPFAALNYKEYPIGTQTISGGFAVDYRELQSGNFDGNIGEGINQVQTDMFNKCVYFVTKVLHDGIKNATGVKHFHEANGIVKTSVDDMLKTMRRYGKVNMCGDYSTISAFNDFMGYKTFGDTTIPFGSNVVADEIRKTGLVSYYNGAFITELPNGINFTKLNKEGNDFELYLPQGLLFFIPQGSISPLQIFQRGGLTSMVGDDIVTRQHLTRFDMEIGADVARGMEHWIGLVSDLNYDIPEI